MAVQLPINVFLDNAKALRKDIQDQFNNIYLNINQQQLNGQIASIKQRLASISGPNGGGGNPIQNLQALSKQYNDLDQLTKKVTNSHKDLAGSAQKAAAQFSTFAERVGFTTNRLAAYLIPAGAIYGLTSVFSKAKDAVIELNTETNKLTQVFGGNADRAKQISEAALQIAVRYGQSSQELFKIAANLSKTGLFASDSSLLKTLDTIGKAQLSVGFENIGDSIDDLTVLLTQFNLKGEDTAKVLESIAKVAQSSKLKFADVIEISKFGGADFASTGGNVNQFIGLAGGIKQLGGLNNTQIGAGLSTLTNKLHGASTLESLRKFTGDQDLGSKDLIEQLQVIAKASKGKNREELQKIFSEGGGPGQTKTIIPILDDLAKGKDSRILKYTSDANNAGGTLDKNALIGLDNISTKLQSTAEKFNQVFKELSQNEGIKKLIDDLFRLANGFAYILEKAAPLIPILLKLGAVKLASGILGGAGADFFKGFTRNLTATGAVSKFNESATPAGISGSPTGVATPKEKPLSFFQTFKQLNKEQNDALINRREEAYTVQSRARAALADLDASDKISTAERQKLLFRKTLLESKTDAFDKKFNKKIGNYPLVTNQEIDDYNKHKTELNRTNLQIQDNTALQQKSLAGRFGPFNALNSELKSASALSDQLSPGARFKRGANVFNNLARNRINAFGNAALDAAAPLAPYAIAGGLQYLSSSSAFKADQLDVQNGGGALRDDYQSVIAANKRKSAQGGALSGAATGLAIGASFGPQAAAVGVVAGAAVGYFTGLSEATKKATDSLLGLAISAKSAKDREKALAAGVLEGTKINYGGYDLGLLYHRIDSYFEKDKDGQYVGDENYKREKVDTLLKDNPLIKNQIFDSVIDKADDIYKRGNGKISIKEAFEKSKTEREATLGKELKDRGLADLTVERALGNEGFTHLNEIIDNRTKAESDLVKAIFTAKNGVEQFVNQLKTSTEQLTLLTAGKNLGNNITSQIFGSASGSGAFQLPQGLGEILGKQLLSNIGDVGLTTGNRQQTSDNIFKVVQGKTNGILTPEEQKVVSDLGYVQSKVGAFSGQFRNTYGSGKDLTKGSDDVVLLQETIRQQISKDAAQDKSVLKSDQVKGEYDDLTNKFIEAIGNDAAGFIKDGTAFTKKFIESYDNGSVIVSKFAAVINDLSADFDKQRQSLERIIVIEDKYTELKIKSNAIETEALQRNKSLGLSDRQSLSASSDILNNARFDPNGLSRSAGTLSRVQLNATKQGIKLTDLIGAENSNALTNALRSGDQGAIKKITDGYTGKEDVLGVIKDNISAQTELIAAQHDYKRSLQDTEEKINLTKAAFSELTSVINARISADQAIGRSPLRDIRKAEFSANRLLSVFAGSGLEGLSRADFGKLSKDKQSELTKNATNLLNNPFVLRLLEQSQLLSGKAQPGGSGATIGNLTELATLLRGISSGNVGGKDDLPDLMKDQLELSRDIYKLEQATLTEQQKLNQNLEKLNSLLEKGPVGGGVSSVDHKVDATVVVNGFDNTSKGVVATSIVSGVAKKLSSLLKQGGSPSEMNIADSIDSAVALLSNYNT